MSNEAKDRRNVLIDYEDKSLEHAQNLILIRSALEGVLHMEECEGSEYPKEERADLIYLCVRHLTHAARHLKETPYLEA